MKIIVTGGAGFIGSHLVDAYIKAGHKVSVIDNLDTGKKIFVNPKAKFYKISVTDLKKMDVIFKKERPDLVVHLAAFDYITRSVKEPENAVKVNVLGTLNVLKLMVKYGSKKIIFASTGGPLYGFSPKPLPLKEDRPIESVSPYGASKAFAEETIRLYYRLYGIKYTVFRYPNVYGPRQYPKGVGKAVAIFSKLILRNKRPTIFGDGSKFRDYAYIDDVVRAHLLAIKKGDNETINIGWGKPTSDLELLNAVKKALGSNIVPIFGKRQPGEVDGFYLDVTKAKKLLGWKAKITMKQGMKKTAEYYKLCKKLKKKFIR
ncbi:MAG: GDP-mannose 4,6-dehydratase [Candidatus Wolfebacteria bacterium]|nr:GDP-mannose 4,6-dehydratase [Candidatus Wolfebacteria bacterium]